MSVKEKFKILVVDDERSNIDILTYILKPKHTVLIAKDGRTAIDVAKNGSPDLILLDIVMPGMSGFETLAELKSSDLTRNIPVIFITGRDNAEDEKKGFAMGAVDYITKPFHNSVVEARVGNHLKIVEYIHTIERLCKLDALTNLPNRRGFDDRIKIEWERSAHNKTSISILMIDIDKFKIYNDTYGHPQGDVMLCAISSAIRRSLKRPADFAARWGGEEFAVLLPDTDLDGAIDVAERIRADIERVSIPCPKGIDTKITASVGVNSEIPDFDLCIADFINGADKALYTAKDAGRNNVKSIKDI